MSRAGAIYRDVFRATLPDTNHPGDADRSTLADNAEAVQTAIGEAKAEGRSKVLVPAKLIPYDASKVTFDDGVQMIREGNRRDAYDVKAYGAAGDGPSGTDDLAAINAAASAADANGYDEVVHPPGTYTVSADPTFPGSTRPVGQASYDGSSITVTQSGFDKVIGDDSVATVSFDRPRLTLHVHTDGESGLAFVDYGNGSVTSISTTTNVNFTTGDLGGTTGTDGALTVSADSAGSHIDIENRLGSQVTATIIPVQ